MMKPSPDYERLVHEHHAAVYQSAWRILRHEEDARDVAQDVFLDVLGEPDRFATAQDPARVLRWLAARKALARQRKERNRRGREEDRMMSSEQQSSDEMVSEAEVRGIVAHELAGLADDLRCALVLRFDEGMSFTDMGTSLGVSAPSARDRVERGLERLRTRLGQKGCAAFLPQLAQFLSSDSAVTPPAGLEAGLLALSAGAAKGLSLALVLGIASVVLMSVAVATTVLSPDESANVELFGAAPLAANTTETARDDLLAPPSLETPRVDLASEIEREAAGDASNAVEAQSANRGRVVGRLVDAKGAPQSAVRVFVRSVARDGKLSRYQGEGTSNKTGVFSIRVPVEQETGQRYYLLTRHDLFVAHRSDEVLVKPEEQHELGDIELLRKSDDIPGEWTADLYVVDKCGVPVSGAVVIVERKLLVEHHPWNADVEARGATDAAGRIQVAGKWLGEKLARIQAEGQGFRSAVLDLSITRQGHNVLTFVVEKGFSVTGRVHAFDEAALPQGLQVHAVGRDKSRWLNARVLADGRFELTGLDIEDEYELVADAYNYSPARRLGLQPDAGELLFELKRSDDTRDVGDHMAELHGRVVDGATGSRVAVDEFAVEELWIATEDAERPAEWLFAHYRIGSMAQRMAQRMAREPESEFHKVGMSPGTLLLVAQVQGHAPALAGPFALGEGQIESGVVLTLMPGATLAGRVTDANGKPVEGAFVWLDADSPDAATRLAGLDKTLLSEDPRWLPRCARSDKAGHFRFEHLPSALPYRLGVLRPSHEPSLGEVVTPKEGEVRADLALRVGARR